VLYEFITTYRDAILQRASTTGPRDRGRRHPRSCHSGCSRRRWGLLASPMRAPRHRDHLFHAIVITHSTAS
jgi:hypothetical protein